MLTVNASWSVFTFIAEISAGKLSYDGTDYSFKTVTSPTALPFTTKTVPSGDNTFTAVVDVLKAKIAGFFLPTASTKYMRCYFTHSNDKVVLETGTDKKMATGTYEEVLYAPTSPSGPNNTTKSGAYAYGLTFTAMVALIASFF